MRTYSFNKYAGIAPAIRESLNYLFETGGLPLIKGTWYFVDPANGTSTASGEHDSPVDSIVTAYARCTSGAGDGIVLLSGGTTTADTTSYITQPLDWAKYAITVVGASAPTSMFGRARVASGTQITTGAITTLAFVDGGASADTITDSANGFVTAGFEAGMTINVTTNSGTNDGQYTIASVAAGTLTLVSGDAVTTEDAATAGSSTITNYLPYLIDVQGDNNAFYNVHIANYGSTAVDLGGVKVSGNRNYFGNCHIIGAGHATPGAVATAYSVSLDGAQEVTFDRCTFGTDSVLKAAANGEVIIDSSAWRAQFNDCLFTSYSATAGKGAVKSVDATSFSGVIDFRGCIFQNWNENGITAVDDVFIGTAPTSGAYAVTPDSMSVGFTGWGTKVYVAGAAAAASAGGQIGTIE